MNFKSATINSIAKSFLSIVQTSAKSTTTGQLLEIKCNDENDTSCTDCYKITKDYFTNDEVLKICKPICECNISNINMTQNVTINFESFQGEESKQTFQTEVMNNIFMEAKKSGTELFFDSSGNRQANIYKSIDTLYNNMVTSNFNLAIQQAVSAQTLIIKSNNVYNITLDSLVNITSLIVQNSESISDSLNSLIKEITMLNTQILKQGLSEIIKLIVKIAMYFFIALTVIFGIILTLNIVALA
jgi:hypothetical protein